MGTTSAITVSEQATISNARSRPERELGPPWRKLLLTTHVVTTVSLIGADLVLLILGIVGLRGADPRTVYPAMSLVSSWLMAPLAVAALVTGVLQGVLTRWGIVKHWWTAIKLTITAVLTSVVLFVLVPGLREAADAAHGSMPETFLSTGQRMLYVIGPSISVTLLVVNAALGIYKPKRRLRLFAQMRG